MPENDKDDGGIEQKCFMNFPVIEKYEAGQVFRGCGAVEERFHWKLLFSECNLVEIRFPEIQLYDGVAAPQDPAIAGNPSGSMKGLNIEKLECFPEVAVLGNEIKTAKMVGPSESATVLKAVMPIAMILGCYRDSGNGARDGQCFEIQPAVRIFQCTETLKSVSVIKTKNIFRTFNI
ncbi:hypothetical protein [Gluconobacter aidae]|uniref:Uncharacterized protein n=1 Tax=Gluconobacter aidae TaxID=2662454 RepID=A0A7X1SQP5_9PROT|nr:hypothetical protein [Gluconobacter aidae]MQR99407.1 hypothetical protein [Gluconobacter aidae]